jgi:ketosteroid isomerase-like protein
MTREEAVRFAREWVDAWNRRDIETVLAHYVDDLVFTSPRALETVGVPTVVGKPALRSYWQKALGKVQSLTFTLERTVWDPELRELAIIYARDINGRKDRASENHRFDTAGRVVGAEVFYGVTP